MLDIFAGTYSRLSADATLTAGLATYLGAPAIFSEGIPSQHELTAAPSIVIDAPLSDEDEDTFDTDGRVVAFNIRAYSLNQGGTLALDTAAQRVRKLIKDWPAGAFPGGSIVDAVAAGPNSAPVTSPEVSGRVIIARLFLQET